jgi:hypothetical protein
MSGKGIILIVSAFFIFIPAFSQSHQGKVIDSRTKLPVPYTSIKEKHRKTQAVANADGQFELSPELFSGQDTVIFSCVGYKPQSVAVRTLSATTVIILNPVIYQLKPVDVTSKGNTDYPYQLFSELCRKYRNYHGLSHSKGYFSFLSQSGDIPLEIAESYFTVDESCSNGILQLHLKDGRIGLCHNNFYSLNTTDIITHFSPFSLAGNLNIPSSAGNFGYHRLKKLFDVRIIQTSVENGMKKFILQFRVKKDNVQLFSGLAWINATEGTIEELDYSLNTGDFYYLEPVIKGDRTDNISMSLKFIFDNSDKDHPQIARVALDYSLLYRSSNTASTIRIVSEGNLLLYDFSQPFPGILPPGLVDGQENDYQKIGCLPYDSLFWSMPGITIRSDKQKEFIDYFRTHGTLVNFSRSLDSIAGSNYLRWNADSDVSFTDILNRTPIHEMQLVSEGAVTKFKTTGNEPYDIICKILFNPVVVGDSLHLSSVTLLNKNDSYYFLGHSLTATTFINLFFDLYELKRREIMAECKQVTKNHKLTFDEFHSIYSNGLRQLNDTIKIYQAETTGGTSEKGLLKWHTYISEKTGIDRSRLVQNIKVKSEE